jgi:DNA-binding beta-propeller fold protein YncE
MRKVFVTQVAIGAMALLAWSLLGTVPASQAAKTVNFIATDEPGPWFKCVGTLEQGCVPSSLAKTESLALVNLGDSVKITSGVATDTVHTFTSLLWPTGALSMPFDQPAAFGVGAEESKTTPPLDKAGLYVFVCKLHPFMLAAVVVDDPTTPAAQDGLPVLDLGSEITLISYYPRLSFPTSSDLATRLLRAFFLITNPANYQDHNPATNKKSLTGRPDMTWHIDYPNVNVGTNLGVLNLPAVLVDRYGQDTPLEGPSNPSRAGVGEIWVDAEYEKTSGKSKPGTAIAVDAGTWKVIKRVALPNQNMNNPHNMWTNKNQTRIYQTQWFSNKLTVFNRITGAWMRDISVGESPAHVMTRVDTDQVHVSINGGGEVVELNSLAASIDRHIRTQKDGEELPAQPHAHWMSFDGKTMVTPNSNTNDSTRVNIGHPDAPIVDKPKTGTLPIATGMMPDASKYYVSNYLDSTITCISIKSGACKEADAAGMKTINLLLGGGKLANYDPSGGYVAPGMTQSGALPIQTPVSPDGKFVITANTLSGTISIISTETDTLVAILPCSAGCHGVNFGAKKGGGYYAYVSSKFSNDLIIVDYDPNNNGKVLDAKIAGRVILVARGNIKVSDDTVDEHFKGLAGMGGQGVLPIPLVYNGWVQNLPRFWKFQLTKEQRNPFPLDDAQVSEEQPE